MKEDKFDIVNLLMQPYVLQIIKLLDKPRRFNDILKYIKNRKTLTLKLSKMRKYGLIEDFALKTEKGFVNSYRASKKGKDIVKKLETL